MKEQMKKQFNQFQDGLKSAFGAAPKMVEPALRSNQVAIDSLGQLVNDQIEFGRTCMDIGQRQMESLASGKDPSAMLRDLEAPSEYYTAATHYGEALRQNADNTRERMLAIGREAANTATGASKQAG